MSDFAIIMISRLENIIKIAHENTIGIIEEYGFNTKSIEEINFIETLAESFDIKLEKYDYKKNGIYR